MKLENWYLLSVRSVLLQFRITKVTAKRNLLSSLKYKRTHFCLFNICGKKGTHPDNHAVWWCRFGAYATLRWSFLPLGRVLGWQQDHQKWPGQHQRRRNQQSLQQTTVVICCPKALNSANIKISRDASLPLVNGITLISSFQQSPSEPHFHRFYNYDHI